MKKGRLLSTQSFQTSKKGEISDVQKKFKSSKTENKNSDYEKIYANLLNLKDKFIFKSYYDEENSKIFLDEKNETLKDILINDTLPEDYKIIKASNFTLKYTYKSRKNVNNIDGLIFCSNPYDISFRNENSNNNDNNIINYDYIHNKNNKNINILSINEFSFRYNNENNI